MVLTASLNEIFLLGAPEDKVDCSYIWRGTMNKECSNISWKHINVSLPHMYLRTRNLSSSIFKLRNNVYFLENRETARLFSPHEQNMISRYVGGRLNIQEEKYHRYEYWVPTSIKHIISATTDKNEVFALIRCAVNDERLGSREHATVNRRSARYVVMYFDEDNGFCHTMNNKQLQRPFSGLKNDSECSFDKLIRIK